MMVRKELFNIISVRRQYDGFAGPELATGGKQPFSLDAILVAPSSLIVHATSLSSVLPMLLQLSRSVALENSL